MSDSLILRPLFDRSPPRRREPLVQLANMMQLEAVGALERARDVVGGGCSSDYVEEMKRRLMACGAFQGPFYGGNGCPAPNAANAAPGMGGANMADPCNDWLQEVTQGGQQAGALAAGASFSITITVQVLFKPLLISIPDTVAPSVKITSLLYQYDNMLKASFMSGGSFSNKNTTGGWRRPGKILSPGQTITIAGTAVAAIAADTLLVDVTGVTPG